MKKLIHLAVLSALSLPVATLAAQDQKTERQGSPPLTQPSDQRAGQTAASQTQVQSAQAIKATKLVGMNVENQAGKNLGEVQDLVIDINNNRVHYAVLDAQNKMFAYPMRVFTTGPENKHLLLNVSEERLEKAPGMERGEWKKGGAWNKDYQRDVDTYWEREAGRSDPGVTSADRAPARTDQPARIERDTKTESVPGATVKIEPRPDMNLVRASSLVGKNIQNSQGKGIGEIKDLVIDPSSGKVHFAVVDFNDDVVKGDLHPVALSAFSLRDGRDKLVLNVDKGQLQAQRSFDRKQLDSKLSDRNFLQETSGYAASIGGADRGAAGRTGTGEEKPMTEGKQKSGEPQNKSPSGQDRGTQEKSKAY